MKLRLLKNSKHSPQVLSCRLKLWKKKNLVIINLKVMLGL